MTQGQPIFEEDLHAYVDDLLEPERREEVRAYLERHPDVAQRVGTYVMQRCQLRDAAATVADDPAPARLNVRRMIEQRRWSAPLSRSSAAAAAALLLAIGGIAGWTAHTLSTPPQSGVAALAREAAASYRVYALDSVRPVEIPGDQRAQLLRWVSNRLARPVESPDLSTAGYQLIGGRLVSTPHGPAALFLYDNSAGDRLAVLVRPMTRQKDARMSEHVEQGLGGVSWSDDGLGYSLVGPTSPRTLHPLANAVRRQMSEPT